MRVTAQEEMLTNSNNITPSTEEAEIEGVFLISLRYMNRLTVIGVAYEAVS